KMRLTREEYLSVQPIYYPGFTIGGAAEPLSIVLLVALLVLTPAQSSGFWLVLAALAMLIIVQLLFWTMTQPVNRFWFDRAKSRTTPRRLFGTVTPAAPTPD